PMLDALDFLEAQPFVLRAALAGDHLRVVTPNGFDAATLRAALAAQSIRISTLATGAPSMEDVFMTLSQGAEPEP
ncbi:MAG: ABC transporter ATP-binding protein, partial [Caldilineaceae bacterium]|nr:ABC transporter ATP-binding protein [Caldilineaceae bacterium]